MTVDLGMVVFSRSSSDCSLIVQTSGSVPSSKNAWQVVTMVSEEWVPCFNTTFQPGRMVMSFISLDIDCEMRYSFCACNERENVANSSVANNVFAFMVLFLLSAYMTFVIGKSYSFLERNIPKRKVCPCPFVVKKF